ncbi:MAG: hypothetical protein ACOCP8_08205 [archaeon]
MQIDSFSFELNKMICERTKKGENCSIVDNVCLGKCRMKGISYEDFLNKVEEIKNRKLELIK